MCVTFRVEIWNNYHMAKTVKKADRQTKAVKPAKKGYVDPGWGNHTPGQHPVTEILATVNGAMSPFGNETDFPRPYQETGYVHPVTNINH